MAEAWSIEELLAAGWTEADLAWEETAERAAEAIAANQKQFAKDEAGQALRLAREAFEPIDPRLGTALANYGLCLTFAGDTEGNERLYREALAVWQSAQPWIARMDAPRMARSSMFHLRMELRHRDTYRERWRERWQELAAEAKGRIERLIDVQGASTPNAEALARWHRERPAMLNDTRKLMAAVCLLLAPPAQTASN